MTLRVLLGVVEVDPSAEGLGDAGAFTQMLINWGAQFTLWAALASALYGGAMWAWSARGGPSQYGSSGRAYFIGGLVGAAVAALAAPVINTLFEAASNPVVGP